MSVTIERNELQRIQPIGPFGRVPQVSVVFVVAKQFKRGRRRSLGRLAGMNGKIHNNPICSQQEQGKPRFHQQCGRQDDLFGGLRVRFNKPEPLINASGDFRKQVCGVLIIEGIGFVDGHARRPAESGKRAGDGLDMSRAVSNR